VSIRSGWFWHPAGDARVRSVDDLMELYFRSVWQSSKFLLDVPPRQDVVIHPTAADGSGAAVRLGGFSIATDDRLEHLRRLAYWLDEGVPLPGTRYRIGLDPILGLVPGVGDATGAVMAVAILAEAGRRGTSRLTLTRIAANIALDALLGAVPVFGDAFDAIWKANLRNVALLEQHAANPTAARKSDRRFFVLLTGSLFLFCAALVAGGLLLTALLVRLVAAQWAH
jgi:hypothetical protein